MLPPSLRKTPKKKFDKENFFERVFWVVRKIPKGRVTNYGAIANYLGTGMSSRTVGWAMNAAAMLVPPVPAHRVVNRNGLLTGKHHFATPTLMQDLLEAEGIEIIDDGIQDFDKLYWDPIKELNKVNKSKSKKKKTK
jgi:methylated-DNA-protein-cysteine methyltransferase-like protein